ARARALRAARSEPLAARRGTGALAGAGRCPAASGRTSPRGQCAGPESDTRDSGQGGPNCRGMKAPKRRPAQNQSEAPESMLSRLAEAPRAASARAAKQTVAEMVAAAPKAARPDLEAALGAPAAARLLEGVAEGSSYLWGIIAADPALLLRLL